MCSGLPLLVAPDLQDEPAGVGALARLGELVYGEADPAAALAPAAPAMRVEDDGGRLVLCLPLRAVNSSEVLVSQSGDRLTVRAGPARRGMMLPPALAGRTCVGGRLDGGTLRLRFE
jgi:arsenite-transporting ATPase